MDSWTDAVTNTSNDPTEATYDLHSWGPMYTGADQDEIYGPYDPEPAAHTYQSGNPDVDAMSSNAHQDYSSLALDSNTEALLINAGDASQISRNRSRTQAFLTETHTERPSSNTQLTYPIGTLSPGGSLGMGGTNRPHTGNPRRKRRRTGDRESSDTDLAGRLSSSTIPTNRTSTSTDRTSISSTSTTPAPLDREHAFCPMCNMGDGKFGGPNNRISAGTRGSIGQSKPQWKPNGSHFVVAKPTTAPNTFKKHMTMDHKKFFSRIFFSDFLCGLCACACTPQCVARFRDWDTLLEHVWEFHKHASLNHGWHSHCCDFVFASASSGLQSIHDAGM